MSGGQNNTAAGDRSWAAGSNAKALHTGTFVWADTYSSLNFSSTASYQFLIRATGGVGIGLSNPSQQLDVNGDISIRGTHLVYNSANGIIDWGAGTSGDLYFRTLTTQGDINTPTERMIIKNNGRVGIGTTAPNYPLEVNGDINAIGFVRSNGTVLTSDVRFKKNISTLMNALDRVTKLRGVSYDWKKDAFPEKQFSREKQIGFIAQEIEQGFPELVSTGADGYKGVDYARLTPVLVEAVKELHEMNKKLADRVLDLEVLVKSLAGHGSEANNRLRDNSH